VLGYVMTRSPSMISLFSGAGGLDLGLERAGFHTCAAVEVDRWARATLEKNRAHFARNFWLLDDVTMYPPAQIVNFAGLAPGRVELVAGGPPCQSFSTAGRRGSIGDPRGGLFANFAAVVDAARPRFFVMENVRGILSASIRHRPLAERGAGAPPLRADEKQGSAFRVIHNVLEHQLGYQVVVGLVDSADYGVPQNRVRVIILGSRDREFASNDIEEIMPPTHRGRWQTLRDAIARLPRHNPEHQRYTADREAIMRLVPPGKNWRWFRDNPKYGDEFVRRIMGGAWGADGGKVGFFRRLEWDKPSPTLPTSPIQKSTSLCHPDKNRPLSVQEYAAIQQFPPDYEFAGGTAQKYKQIGNAVPVGLGFAIGNALLSITKPRRTRVRSKQRELALTR
jgi:DNA (cytosine-5)-methyltransferase 1